MLDTARRDSHDVVAILIVNDSVITDQTSFNLCEIASTNQSIAPFDYNPN